MSEFENLLVHAERLSQKQDAAAKRLAAKIDRTTSEAYAAEHEQAKRCSQFKKADFTEPDQKLSSVEHNIKVFSGKGGSLYTSDNLGTSVRASRSDGAGINDQPYGSIKTASRVSKTKTSNIKMAKLCPSKLTRPSFNDIMNLSKNFDSESLRMIRIKSGINELDRPEISGSSSSSESKHITPNSFAHRSLNSRLETKGQLSSLSKNKDSSSPDSKSGRKMFLRSSSRNEQKHPRPKDLESKSWIQIQEGMPVRYSRNTQSTDQEEHPPKHDKFDYRNEIWKLFGRDRNSYVNKDLASDDDGVEEADSFSVFDEELAAAQIAKCEDQAEKIREQERARLKRLRKRKT